MTVEGKRQTSLSERNTQATDHGVAGGNSPSNAVVLFAYKEIYTTNEKSVVIVPVANGFVSST
jgi:hypothetical protein